MRSGIVLVFLLVIVCLQDYHIVFAGAPGQRQLRGDYGGLRDQGPLGVPGLESKLPFCPVDKNTADFLSKIRKPSVSIKIDGIKTQQESIGLRKQRRIVKRAMSSFPIPNCHHAALNSDEGIYHENVYDCCGECRGKFTLCLISSHPVTFIPTSILCSSKAIHCVNKCLCNNNEKVKPEKETGVTAGRPGQKGAQGRPGPGEPGPDKLQSGCSEVKSSSVRCIKRSCIPI